MNINHIDIVYSLYIWQCIVYVKTKESQFLCHTLTHTYNTRKNYLILPKRTYNLKRYIPKTIIKNTDIIKIFKLNQIFTNRAFYSLNELYETYKNNYILFM